MLSFTLSGVIFTVSPVDSLPVNFLSSCLHPQNKETTTKMTARDMNLFIEFPYGFEMYQLPSAFW